MPYYLGIDGGGSKTAALLADETGRELARFTGKELNFNAVGMETARENLRAVVTGVLGGLSDAPAMTFIGSSALSRAADGALVARFCAGVLPPERVRMDSDLFIALRSMGREPAAVAVCGTGSMAAAVCGGIRLGAGGWGHLLGDEGSGYALARRAVQAVLRRYEGAGEETALTDAVCAFFVAEGKDALIERFYDPAFPRSRIAAFAPQVLTLAEEGDAAAARIVSEEAAAFACTVCSLLERLPAGTPLGLWGGVFENAAFFRARFASDVNARFPETAIALLPQPPVMGAVLAAMDAARENQSNRQVKL